MLATRTPRHAAPTYAKEHAMRLFSIFAHRAFRAYWARRAHYRVSLYKYASRCK